MFFNLSLSTKSKSLLKKIFIVIMLSSIVQPAISKTGTSKSKKLEIIPITTKSFKEIAKFQKNYIPATVVNLEDSIISAEIAGTIEKVNLMVGDFAKKGSSIANIACSDYKSKLNQINLSIESINAEIDLTQWQLDQALKLIKSDHVSQEYIKKFKSTLKKLNAKLNSEKESFKTAKMNVARCNIIAPYDGIITERFVSLGEYMLPGNKVAKLVNTESLELDAKAHITEIVSLQQTTKMFFQLSNNKYPVKLRVIVPNQDPINRTQTVRFSFINKKPTPGSSGKLIWQSENRAIPPEYIRQIDKRYGIFIVKDNKAFFHHLPNVIEGQSVLLDKPITYPIIIDGRYNVTNGQEITIQNGDAQ